MAPAPAPASPLCNEGKTPDAVTAPRPHRVSTRRLGAHRQLDSRQNPSRDPDARSVCDPSARRTAARLEFTSSGRRVDRLGVSPPRRRTPYDAGPPLRLLGRVPSIARGVGHDGQVSLRKEVIQPHLPVRLPCYDFVPIAGPTFDGSLPYGLGHRLRVLLTFVT